MTERHNERISALVDDEIRDIEAEFLVRRLAGDEDAKDCWERYHLIGDAMRNHLPPVVDSDFASRVMAAIDEEPALERLPSGRTVHLLKPVAGVAVAASVAVMAIVGVQWINEETGAVNTVASSRDAYERMPATHWDRQGPVVETRLNTFLVNHNEHASMNRVQGLMPYGRIISYDSVESSNR